MTENQNQLREYDAVKGGESQVPLGAAVLGGISGVKSRLASPIVEVKIAALSEALKYGNAGLDLIMGALQDESMAVKFAAYSLLKDRDELNIKKQLDKYLPIFEFDVITVDSYGIENSRRRHYAHFFPEDLGNGVVLEIVYIPGGTFMMGSFERNESPQHQVTVSAFYAGKYPITQAQWQAVMGKKPSLWKGEKRPVNTVSWDMAVEFCGKLSQQTGKKYRLLSEAEWEYACRAGTTTHCYCGETITPDLASYERREPDPNAPHTRWRTETTDVGSFPPNPFGLYDMYGNVYEWCSDRWHENYNGAPTDGSSWETRPDDRLVLRNGVWKTGSEDYRVQRGGSWCSHSSGCTSHHRSSSSTGSRYETCGFRVALLFA